MRRTILLSITALVAAATLTACGSSGNDTSGGYGDSTPSSEASSAAKTPAAAAAGRASRAPAHPCTTSPVTSRRRDPSR